MHRNKSLACAAALTVGAALSVSVPAGATGDATDSAQAVDSATATSSNSAARIKACRGKQLRISFGRGGGAAGTFYRTIRFKNTGRVCAVRHWPSAGYVGKRGRPVGFLATRPSHRPHKVVLRHGEAGRVTLGTPSPGNYPKVRCGPVRAHRVALYIPGWIRPSARHVRSLPNGPKRVCTTERGAPSLSRMRG